MHCHAGQRNPIIQQLAFKAVLAKDGLLKDDINWNLNSIFVIQEKRKLAYKSATNDQRLINDGRMTVVIDFQMKA